jgi:hypothetical protein
MYARNLVSTREKLGSLPRRKRGYRAADVLRKINGRLVDSSRDAYDTNEAATGRILSEAAREGEVMPENEGHRGSNR